MADKPDKLKEVRVWLTPEEDKKANETRKELNKKPGYNVSRTKLFTDFIRKGLFG